MYVPRKTKRMFTEKAKRMPITWAFFTAAMFLLPALLSAFSPAVSTTASLPVVVSSPSLLSLAWADPPLVSKVNPASRYCLKVGGTVTIRIRGDGRAYGLCQFPDNRACEEWALFRGHCPVGGVKITGFDTIAQQYCAWLGGETLAVPQATCTFPNGRVCNDDALYNGTCDDPVIQPWHKETSTRVCGAMTAWKANRLQISSMKEYIQCR